MTQAHSDLIETWYINHRIVLYLLDAIDADALNVKPIGIRERNVKQMFAHIHQMRLMWLQPIDATRAQTVTPIPTQHSKDLFMLTKQELASALSASGEALGAGILDRLETNRIDLFKPSPTAFVGYLVSHESYHRGEICMTLTQAGYPVDDAILNGMWIWNKR